MAVLFFEVACSHFLFLMGSYQQRIPKCFGDFGVNEAIYD